MPLRTVTTLAIAWLLVGCTAPAPQADGARTADASQAAEATRPMRRMPPLGGPLPPTRVEDAGCEVDADCAVRTGPDGCGSCVPRAALGAPVPAGAAAATCGMQQTEGCRCVDHRCQARPRMVDSPVGQAADDKAP